MRACIEQNKQLIQLHGIGLALGGQPILEGLTWAIKPGKRVGLIGANGAGKTTLLRLIAGELKADEGTIAQTSNTGYLAQEVEDHASDRTVLEEALTAFGELRALLEEERTLTRSLEDYTDPPAKLLAALERIQTELSIQEAHLVRPRTESVLLGLGFATEDLDRPLHMLSGGYRMRVVLAKILLKKPDVLLLDEPTNHLDIVSIDWLENYLKQYAGTVVLVSHDRYFLNRMVTSIAHLRRGRVTEYTGNYDTFLEERAKRRILEQAAYDNQQRAIAQAERFIERFRYKNTKARQVQSRIKHLEKMDRLLPPEAEEAPIKIRFPVARQPGRIVLQLSEFSKRYVTPDSPDVTVFEHAAALSIERGDKIALIGKNGAGKSTLARILNGTEPMQGTRKLGHNVDPGFFAQHQAEDLARRNTVLESLATVATGTPEGALRTLLGAFLFTGDDVFKPVRVLSGGEKSRLALARTLVEGANFLILDEPTNHLDIQSIQVLIEALRQYQGTFVVVSHDRHFLDQVANTIWHVEAGQVRTYRGTYAEWHWHVTHGSGQRLAPREAQARPNAVKRTRRSGGPKTKEEKRREAEARNRAYAAARSGKESPSTDLTARQRRAVMQKTEGDIESLERRRESIEARLSDAAWCQVPGRVAEAGAEYAEVQRELDVLYQRWEVLAEQL